MNDKEWEKQELDNKVDEFLENREILCFVDIFQKKIYLPNIYLCSLYCYHKS